MGNFKVNNNKIFRSVSLPFIWGGGADFLQDAVFWPMLHELLWNYE
jgi:hypothetical protein